MCPRCKKPLPGEAGDANSAHADSASAAPPPRGGLPQVYDGSVPPTLLREAAAPVEEKAPQGARLAGAIMIVNGLALLAETSLGMDGPVKIGSSTSSPTRLLFAFVIGALVLSGSTKAVKVARVLVGISGVVLPVLLFSQNQPLLATLQLAFSASLLLLLFGDAGRLRMGVAIALATGFFALEAAGLYGTVSGRHPLGRLMMAGQLAPGPVTEVEGAEVRYRLSVPGKSWYLRTAAAAHKDNPLADRWLVRPDRDAHVLVIAETLPSGTAATMDRFRKTVVANMSKAGKNFAVVDEGPLVTALEAGHLVHARSQLNGQPVEWLIGLYIQHPYIIQVLAFGNGRAFSDLEPEMRGIVTSLDL